jgi:toxin CptA
VAAACGFSYDLSVSIALLAAVVLVFVMGMAVQRGNTCTVVAFDDLLHRRSPERLLAIAYCWLWVAGGLTLLKLTTGFTLGAQLFPITIWSVIGGLTLGIGAVVNGACTVGTVARIGSGEYTYGLTLVGFFLGCVLAPHVFGRTATSHTGSAAATTSVDYPVFALFGLAVVVALTVRRLATHERESFRDFLHKAWDPRTALMIVAVLFVVVVHVYGAWAYTDLLGDVAKGVDKQIVARFTLFAALLAGAIVGGRTLRGTRTIGPLAPRAIRCTLGGMLMGIGFSLAPGAFDGMTLLGQPLLLPFAWVVMGASYLTVVLGVLYLRSGLGSWITTRRG